MKLAESILALSVLGLAGFIGVQTVATHRRTRTESAGAIDPRFPRPTDARGPAGGGKTGRVTRSSIVNLPGALPVSGTTTNPEPAFGDVGVAVVRNVRGHLGSSARGTYIAELLVARDSALARWPERRARPLRVWIDDMVMRTEWNPDFPSAVRDAFSTWSATGIPVRFDFVRDSATADIHVRFVDRLPNDISGKTIWSRDARFWLVSSDIQLALLHPSGGGVTPPQMRAIALHEVGHLLGLDHTSSEENIMSPRVRVRELSDADRATVRLLYELPAGSVK